MSDIHIHCPHFSNCSGCTHNEHINRLPVFNEAQLYFTSKGISSLKLHVGNPTGWRCRAKLAIRGTMDHPLIGLFEEGSHKVINIPQCSVHHPSINKAVEILKEWITSQKIAPYDESSRKGTLRYAQFAVDRATGRVQLSLVLNKYKEAVDEELVKSLWILQPTLWHSLWLNYNTRQDNIIFGDVWSHIFGELWLWEAVHGRAVCFYPASFAQANPEMFDRLLNSLENFLPSNADVLEFYAGVGSIGLAIASKCRRVQCIEINPLANKCFEETLRSLPVDLAKRLSFISGSAGSYLHLLNDIDSETGVAVVDPPRKGLDPALLKSFCQTKALKNLIYVSCGWSSFQRDCNHLLKEGWQLAHAEAFLFFPGNDQLEILASFIR